MNLAQFAAEYQMQHDGRPLITPYEPPAPAEPSYRNLNRASREDRESQIIGLLKAGGRMKPGTIAHQLGLAPGWCSELLKQMSDAGKIERIGLRNCEYRLPA